MAVELIDYDKFNAAVIDWSRGTRREYLAAMPKAGIKRYSGQLAAKLGSRSRKKTGKIFMVSFPFPKQGVWTYHGVGRGVPITKAGTPSTKRKPKKWWDEVQTKRLPLLEIKIAPIYANAAFRVFGSNVK
jgi:hypothetical protein